MEREYKFHHTRRWRFDFAWPDKKVALEIEGGIWRGGRHTNPLGFIADCEKYNTALAEGWKVIRCPSPHINADCMIEWVRAVLEQ